MEFANQYLEFSGQTTARPVVSREFFFSRQLSRDPSRGKRDSSFRALDYMIGSIATTDNMLIPVPCKIN